MAKTERELSLIQKTARSKDLLMRGLIVPQSLIDDINSAFKKTPDPSNRSDIAIPVPRDPILPDKIVFTEYSDLTPRGREIVNLQKTILGESGVKVLGVRQVLDRGRASEVEIYIEDDKRKVVGGRLQVSGINGKKETIITKHY